MQKIKTDKIKILGIALVCLCIVGGALFTDIKILPKILTMQENDLEAITQEYLNTIEQYKKIAREANIAQLAMGEKLKAFPNEVYTYDSPKIENLENKYFEKIRELVNLFDKSITALNNNHIKQQKVIEKGIEVGQMTQTPQVSKINKIQYRYRITLNELNIVQIKLLLAFTEMRNSPDKFDYSTIENKLDKLASEIAKLEAQILSLQAKALEKYDELTKVKVDNESELSKITDEFEAILNSREEVAQKLIASTNEYIKIIDKARIRL